MHDLETLRITITQKLLKFYVKQQSMRDSGLTDVSMLRYYRFPTQKQRGRHQNIGVTVRLLRGRPSVSCVLRSSPSRIYRKC